MVKKPTAPAAVRTVAKKKAAPAKRGPAKNESATLGFSPDATVRSRQFKIG